MTIDMGHAGSPSEALQAMLWQKKYWIVAGILLGALGGMAWVVARPPLYRSTAVVELVGMNESFMGMNQVDPQAGTGSYSATAANIQTQIQVIMSRSLRQRTVERINLEVIPMNSPTSLDVFGRLRSLFGVIPREPVEMNRQAIDIASESVRARGVGVSRLIDISSDSSSPEVAAAFANTLATEYISQSVQFRSGTAQRTSQWMEGQMEETKSRLEQAEAKLQEYVQKSGNTYVLEQGTLDDSKLRQLQSDLSTMQTERITKQSRWEIAKASPVDSVPEILDDGRLRELRGKITGLTTERAQLLTTYTTEHYKVKRVAAQMEELEKALQKEKADLVKRIQNEYDAALKREKGVLDAYNTQARRLSAQSGRAAEYVMLKRDVELTRQAYNILLQQTNQAAVVAAVPTNNLRIVDAAAVSKIPVSPKPSRDIPTAMLLGGLTAVGLLIVRGKSQERKHSRVFSAPGLSGNSLNVPELGVIPSLAPERPARTMPFRARLEQPLPSGTELAMWRDKPSYMTDSFRYALTSILGLKDSVGCSVIVVTSPSPREGKTTLVSNLAIAMAETGRRVLLLDADLRASRVHDIFNQAVSPGCRDIINSTEPIDAEYLKRFVRSTAVQGLSLLPAGGDGSADAIGELLFSKRVLNLFEHLRESFDVVLIDTPPMLYLPDARILGRQADGVILVVRSGVTSRESAAHAVHRFHADRIPVLGTILNDWMPADGMEEYRNYTKYYSRHNTTEG